MNKITISNIINVFVTIMLAISGLFAQAKYPGEGTDSLKWVDYTKTSGDFFQDPADQPSTAGGDFFFSTSNPSSVALAYDGNNAFFRMQVEGNPAGAGGILNSIGVYVVELAPSNAITENDFIVAVGIDGNNSDDFVYISNFNGSIDNVIYTNSANPGGFRSYQVLGEITYYVEFQVPLTSIASIWPGFSAATPLKVFFGTSSNHNNITKDFLNGNVVDFTVVSITDFESIGKGLVPVELTSFSAQVSEKNVLLKWETATEANNYGFQIERRMEKSSWQNIAFVEGHGTSNAPKDYSYLNEVQLSGKYYYRLKQIDFGGTFDYSTIVEIVINNPQSFALNQNYPNPFNPSTSIQFSLPQQTQLKISLYNILGELIETIAKGVFEAGYHKVAFNSINLPSGTYIYRIESKDFVEAKKMVLMR